MTDEQLLREMAGGSTGVHALETLIYRYHAAIQTYMYRMLGSQTMAEDLTQECFIRVMSAVRNKRLPDTFRPWIYRIATNLCRDYWRRAYYRNENGRNPQIELLPSEDNVAFIYEKQLDRELVVSALNQLPPEKKELIILRFYQELKLEEIANILELPLSTVKYRLYQCLKDLHHLMEEQYGESTKAAVKGSFTRRGKVTTRT